MNLALSGLASDNDMDNEDKINAMMEGRKLLKNASYFAFTATPKNKTLETFGKKLTDEKGNPIYNEDGTQKALAFHVYTMKQAIQEGFILDVLKNYTPIDSFYKLKKIVEDDPQFDKKKAQKKLRAFVESDSYTIDKKAAMMVEHFHEQVIAKGKIGGQARAMVVTSSIPRCIEYFYAINKHLAERHSPYKAIVAFSGDHKYNGQEPPLTSAIMNGFADSKIPKEFKKDPYRFLVVADMFQTGFDEPLLHTMYVDKQLYDIQAVQTLSRLNRCHPKKHDTCVLDFANKPEIIQESFSRYYRTTILSGETDPNKLYDLISAMEKHQVYSRDDIENEVNLYLTGKVILLIQTCDLGGDIRMMELLEDVLIRCSECGSVIEIHKEEIEFDAFTYDHGENGMGDEIEYRYDGVIVCEECGNEIQFRISGFEYPVGAYNYDDYEIYGGDFEKSPIVGIVYSQEEFDIDYAYNEFNRVERLILEISDNPDLIYNISPREFEEVINRVLQDEGFETELTQATRDGGRDIVATKYEMGKPIVFYIECKRYGRRNSVGVSIVRSLYGVQTSDQINKSILVTTGHVTRGARRFVEKQNTMMSILDVNEIHHLIQRSAMKYR